jgi:ABC-type amino acid transport substrate-binding protein
MRSLLITVLLAMAASAAAQPPADEPLRVLLRVAPPFVIDEGDGEFSGISVDLWRGIAEDRQLPYEFEVFGLDAMLDVVAGGEADVGVGATTVTAAREQRLDFMHPFLSSGLAIAAPSAGSPWTTVLTRIVSWDFLRAVGALAVLLLAVGLVVWLFERRRNPDEFQSETARGLWSSFWFAAVTMTTVGYGDKAPVSIGGRVVALVWMFASIIVISFFTASIATALTVQSLAQGIEGPSDLPGLQVGAVRATTGAAYLSRELEIEPQEFETTRAAVRALARGEIDAIVHDAPILRWELREHGSDDLEVLPDRIERQDYAFVLPPDSPRREDLNRALLDQIESPRFVRMLEFYLGR